MQTILDVSVPIIVEETVSVHAKEDVKADVHMVAREDVTVVAGQVAQENVKVVVMAVACLLVSIIAQIHVNTTSNKEHDGYIYYCQ